MATQPTADIQDRATVLANEPCRVCEGDGVTVINFGHGFGNSEDTCPACRGAGRWLPEVVRVKCKGWPVHPDLTENGESYCTKDAACVCQGRGWTASMDLAKWLRAGAMATRKILVLWTDGPGWRCDVKTNDLNLEILHTGWSTGWPNAGLELEGPAPFEPDPLEAVVNALERTREAL